MLRSFVAAFLVSVSSLSFASDSGYQNITRIQQWTAVLGGMGAPGFNVFLDGPAHRCGSNIYYLTHEQVEAGRGKSAISMILAAKMSGKKISITFECASGTQAASIWGVDIQQ